MRVFKQCALLIALVIASMQPLAPIHAATGIIGLTSFTLNKREVGKGETIIATYQLNRPAKRVRIVATSFDGGPLSFDFPQTITMDARRTFGTITFSVPSDAGTLSPLLIQLNIDGQLRGLHMLKVTCDTPWFFEPRVNTCPFEPVVSSPAAAQHFEHGAMIWLQKTNSIYVLYNEDETTYTIGAYKLERFDDAFKDGMPESDPNIKAPEGKYQPVRGFGSVWRQNASVMNRLGWAVDRERGYSACFGYAFGGRSTMRSYVSTPSGELVEFETNTIPVGWRVLTMIDSKPVTLSACAAHP